MDAQARGARALAELLDELPLVEPLFGSLVRNAEVAGREPDPRPLIEHWLTRTTGDPRTEMRYRWELCHRRGVPMPRYAPDETKWGTWRQREQSRLGPFGFEARLLTPIVVSENAELLCTLARGTGELADLARQLLAEAAPVFRRDLAHAVQMSEPWEDTFALWCIAQQPHTLALLHPIAVAIAAVYAAGCTGPIRGTRHPFAGVPLVSASAQLAMSLLLLGSDLELVAALGDFVLNERRESGGWGDGSEPEDPITTLVCADLASRIDPTFECGPTRTYLERAQGDDGLFRALGPEAPWLTVRALSFLRSAQQPFADRFRWPHRAETMRDHKTGIPFFAYFAELAQLFRTLPGLSGERVEIAFIDLIGFRAFNNRHGQDAGDEVLHLFATELTGIPTTSAIRDGGDEFLVVGAPTRTDLLGSMEAFQQRWPARFREVFGDDVPTVAPRILVASTPGHDLRHAREELGRRIGALKEDPRNELPEGILEETAL